MRRLILGILITCIMLIASDNGTYSKVILKIGDIKLSEKYDVFTEDNKEYTVQFQKIALKSKEKSNKIEISATVGSGDGRYTRPRNGSFEFKFNNDKKIYKINGSSCCLNYVYATIFKDKNIELIKKLESKDYVYVKITVIGYSNTYKIHLKGSTEILHKARFIK